MRTLLRWATLIVVTCLPNVVWAASGIVLNVSTATIVPGATITGSGTPTGTMDIANGAGKAIDALGIGTASTNVTTISITGGGYLYASPYNLDVTLSGSAKNNTVTITATIGSFTNPTTSFGVSNCLLAAGSCSSSGSFTALSASPVAVIAPTTVNTNATFTPTIALAALNANGTAYTGSDDITITFTASVPGLSTTATLKLTANLQSVIQLTLGTASSGLTVAPGSDYSMNFGNVNALGIGPPSAGLTKIAVSNGTIYSTPYLVQPFFADQGSTTGKIKINISTSFTHASFLELDDAATCCSAGSFTAIPSAPPPTAQITGVSSGSSITRYLGLLVKKGNGAGSTGSDNAILTFTFTVP
jgi:hypothetical protein